ncbi:MAG TPA: uracil-DNA glycosylase family protein [Rhizobiales bacterium]|nr:uracil-DNA glycosylase family protein [Hyphomicrobiales bacterium]
MPDDPEALAGEVRACRVCRDAPTGPPLPHEPRPVLVVSSRARILIAGQAPGTRVHASGQPFTDRSGDRLRDWLGVDRARFYNPDNFAILPMGFCFPGLDAVGGDLPPRRECAPLWRERLMAAMPQVDLVLAVGLHAQAWHLGRRRSASLTETVRHWRRIFETATTPMILPLPHPSWHNSAWLKRNPWFGTDLLPFLKAQVALRLGGGL